jgi:hypothetical protein
MLLLSACRREEPPVADPGPFVRHDAALEVELSRLPALSRIGVAVTESPEITRVLAESEIDVCDRAWLRRAYEMCTQHRARYHGDRNCFISFRYRGGACTHP